jgi:hypothetical protein
MLLASVGSHGERLVRRASVTISAAVLAASIRIDAEGEAYVRTVVPRENALRTIGQKLRSDRSFFLDLAVRIIRGFRDFSFGLGGLEAIVRVVEGAAARG